MNESSANHHFVGLMLSLHSSAWIHLGKVANPATGKVERNLDGAREVIDLFGALEEKTRGNRVEDEDKLVTQLLNELRMNYVDELERAKSEDKPDSDAQDSTSEPSADASTDASTDASVDGPSAPGTGAASTNPASSDDSAESKKE